MNQALIVSIVCVISGSAPSARAQATERDTPAPTRSKLYKLEELTWPQIDTLNRDRTLFILPMGMIEEHGPHLPVGADTLGVTLALPMRLRAFTAGFPGRACVLR